ncbi:glycosyltransferase family 2 protein [Vagococcus sp.]|uniref:glycosyltransferase family 2 protein n=1 Tax=Vagococcus sp. TaxID=1933889 RepID=UPI003F9937FF
MIPKITVILPMYNSEKWLVRCLNSIRNQTYSNFEVIVVDDGSTDSSKLLYLNTCKFDERFTYIYQENRGVSAARNRGIDQATGEFICFVDSDDYLLKNFLKNMLDLFEGEIEFVSSGYIENIGNNIEKVRLMNGYNEVYSRNKLLQLCIEDINIYGFCWNKMYKKDVIIHNKISFNEDIHFAEDLLFNINYISNIKSGKIGLFSEYIYFYNESSAMRKEIDKTTLKKRLSMIEAWIDILNILENIGYPNRVYLKRRIVKDTSYYYRLSVNRKLGYKRSLKKYSKKFYEFKDYSFKENTKIFLNFFLPNIVCFVLKFTK